MNALIWRTPLLIAVGLLAVANIPSLVATEICRIDVVDDVNGWPVPLVELRANHHVSFVSDNAGLIAFDAPELMGVETWFSIRGHGYRVAMDGFGYEGVRLTPTPGGHLTVKVHRELLAKRLGRLTGAGLFAESQKLGLESAWTEQGILGCDSVQIAEHNGRLFWAWGDTTLANYPLGIFDMLSGTTALRPLESFEPPLRLRFEYFRDDTGRPRGVAKMPGSGPTWISGYVSLPDSVGGQHLVATYIKVKPPLTAYESGLCVWDDRFERFERHRILWERSGTSAEPPLAPDGHPFFWKDADGSEWVLFGDPFPRLKCPATFEAWNDPSQWQVLQPQKTVTSARGDEEIEPHRGSIAWNEFQGKWVSVFTQLHGKQSLLGEIWYAEADKPTGPWANAVKVVTHDNYTFYNPRLHPELTPPDSPILLFEGTYTMQFADHAAPTPRYDYNQILYRLDLTDLAKSAN